MKLIINYGFLVSRLVVFIFSFILLPAAAHALAMAPAQAETDFVPNSQATFDFELINNENWAVSVDLYARGGLAEYVKLNEEKISMKPHESRRIQFAINFPNKIALPSSAFVVARTAARTQKSNAINAYVALEFAVTVKNIGVKPRGTTGQFSAKGFAGGPADIEIVDVRFDNVGRETAKLIIDVKNIGSEDTDVSADIKLGDGKIMRYAKVDPVSVTGSATRRLITYVDVKDMPAGSYDAEVLLKYADQIKKQLVKLQIIEAGNYGRGGEKLYLYIVVGALIAFNVVFVVLIASRSRGKPQD